MFRTLSSSWLRGIAQPVLVSLLLLSGCAAVTPASRVPDAQARYSLATPSPAARSAGIATGTPLRTWWKDLGDPVLDDLVKQAEAQNHDLQSAIAAVSSARALARGAASESMPQGGLEARAVEQRLARIEVDPYRQGMPRPPANRLGVIGQSFAWEIDLFGRIGTATAIAERQVDAASADMRAVRAMVHGEVVTHYVHLRRDQHERALLEEAIAAATTRIAQLKAREIAGLVDQRMVLADEAEQAERAGLLAQAIAGKQANRAALSILVGVSPLADDERLQPLSAHRPMPELPSNLALTQPSDLLARRPDVARADALLRAQLGEVVLAERAHLPHLSLNAVVGAVAPFGLLGQASALRYEAGPVLQWNWFDAGRYKAQEEATQAGAQAAWHHFEQTVLTALAECESSIYQWSAARTAYAQASHATEKVAQASAYTRSRVDAGLEVPTGAIEQHLQRLDAERERLQAHAAVIDAFAQVQLAMGEWVTDARQTTGESR